MRTVLTNLLICFALLFVAAGTVSGHVVVASVVSEDPFQGYCALVGYLLIGIYDPLVTSS